MGDQEIDYLQKLHLSTVCDHHHHPAAAAAAAPLVDTYTTAACGNSAKRSRCQLQEPVSTLHPPFSPSTVAVAADQDLQGFKKIYLSPQPLRRTLSEPIPVFNRQVVAAAGTPPRPPARRNPSRSLSCGESPSSKRLKRMKERLREMSQWWNQVASEDDDDENMESVDHDPKEECEDHLEAPSQEAVFVEKSGECLVLHFKCPCGNGYQILLSGNTCYYKLSNFRASSSSHEILD